MFSNEVLFKDFGNIEDMSDEIKYKWYFFPNAHIQDDDTILKDAFWDVGEKEIIRKLIDGADVPGWDIVFRIFRGSHLDVCVICLRD